MSFVPEDQQPDFSSLVTSLNNSKLQTSNYALWQTIFLLIQAVTRSRDLIVKKLDDLEEEAAVDTTAPTVSNSPVLMPLDPDYNECSCIPFIGSTTFP